MESSTFNTVVSVSATLVGSGILFGLGVVVTYVRALNRQMVTIMLQNENLKTENANQKEQITSIWREIKELRNEIYDWKTKN